MNKPIARILTRLVSDDDNIDDGLFFGTVFKSCINELKPNSIYELQKCPFSDDLVLKYKGDSVIAKGKYTDSPIGVTWAQSFEDVLVSAGKYAFITKDEYDSLPENIRRFHSGN